jgi:hypothetical protein
MRTLSTCTALAVVFLAVTASSANGPRKIAMLDDCDPNDAGWIPTGGCTLRGGEVTEAEFFDALPHGHPAWRNEPSYLKVRGDNRRIRVSNDGGRVHTFTEVAEFGGGFVPPLNNPPGPQTTVPECAGGFANPGVAASTVAPGEELRIENLPPGQHRFQCCLHPWMRAEIRVQ